MSVLQFTAYTTKPLCGACVSWTVTGLYSSIHHTAQPQASEKHSLAAPPCQVVHRPQESAGPWERLPGEQQSLPGLTSTPSAVPRERDGKTDGGEGGGATFSGAKTDAPVGERVQRPGVCPGQGGGLGVSAVCPGCLVFCLLSFFPSLSFSLSFFLSALLPLSLSFSPSSVFFFCCGSRNTMIH